MITAGLRAHPADTLLVRKVAVAVPLLGAALIHGAVVGDHLDEWVLAGLFFLVLQLVQLVLAGLAWLSWSRPVATAVVLTGLGTLVVWAVSRTTGMPVGPAAFRTPEPVGRADLLCGLLELVSVLAALPELVGRQATAGLPRRQGRVLAALVAVAALAVTASALSSALAPALGGHHHGDHAAAQVEAR